MRKCKQRGKLVTEIPTRVQMRGKFNVIFRFSILDSLKIQIFSFAHPHAAQIEKRALHIFLSHLKKGAWTNHCGESLGV